MSNDSWSDPHCVESQPQQLSPKCSACPLILRIIIELSHASGNMRVAQAAIFVFFFHQTAAQNPDARWLMKWKPLATLVLFLRLNHRKWSHTRARATQYRFHVSVFNHIRAVSKPNTVASSLIISRPGPLTQNVQNCGFVVRSHLAQCRSVG